jgi:Domain of unknown function (DUF4340)
MHREHGILAALVCAAALWAYFVAHPLGGASSTQAVVRVWDVPLARVKALTFKDGTTQTQLEPRAGQEPALLWVNATTPARVLPPAPPPAPSKPTPGKPAAGKAEPGKTPPPAPPVPPAPAEESAAFRGNAAAQQLLRSLAALAAERDLGPLAKLEPAQFGLPGKDAFIELQRTDGEPLRLELGRATFGDAGRYAHNPGNDHVYLLRSQELRQLASARGSLMDRDLLGFRTEQATRIELVAGSLARTFHKLAAPGQWGTSAEASEAVAELPPVLGLLDSLRLVRYHDRGEAAPSGAPTLEVRLFKGEAKEPDGWLRLYLPEGNAAATGVSSYTREPVEVARLPVQQLLEKARGLLHGT